MVYSGHQMPTNKVVAGGRPLSQDLKIETVANMYPGRLVQKGTNPDDIIVGTALGAFGWLGFENTQPSYRPTNIDTIYVVNAKASVLNGGGFLPVGSLSAPCIVTKGQSLANWAAGQLIGPAYPAPGGIILSIPFTKSTTVVDTGIDLPDNMMVVDAWVEVTTGVASGTIDVGFENAVESGDLDGLMDAADCATAQKVRPGPTVTTGSNEVYLASNTRGVLLSDFNAGADTATDVGTYVEKPYITDGTIESLVYTTSNHDIVGNIMIQLAAPGLKIVGDAEMNADASSAAVDILVKSVI